MRTPLEVMRRPRTQVANVMSYPAPVGGWNARDALADMDPTDAVALEDWFPKTSYCELRGGYVDHLTGMAADGKTLATYNALSGTNKLVCCTNTGVYDASSAGVAAGTALAGRTNGKHQWVNFGDGTNNYLILVNGVDKPLYYNGTTWVAVDGGTSPALTGLTTTELISVFVSKERLFFIQKASLAFWYLAAGAAGGALTRFDLSAVAKKGGYLMAGATWTVDAGDGPDDRVVFITSEGEVLIYQGNNPSNAAAWALVGVYELGRPLGRRCMTKFGGDLIILTQNGAYPMTSALQSAQVDARAALSFKIQEAFQSATRSYGTHFGWTCVLYPAQAALIVNVPISEDGVHEQYVMNTITKAWCKFTGWLAEDFTVYNGELYFTAGRKVLKAWTGPIDGTNAIRGYGKTAFSYFGKPGQQKLFTLFRPVLAVNGTLNFLTDIDVDFSDGLMTGTATFTIVSGAKWGSALWGQARWAAGLEVVKRWTSPAELPGYCAAGKIKVVTNSLTVQWMACDYVWTGGGTL